MMLLYQKRTHVFGTVKLRATLTGPGPPGAGNLRPESQVVSIWEASCV